MSSVMTPLPQLDRRSYDRIRRIVHEHSGIHLADGKASLVSARLSSRMRTLGLPSFDAYLKLLQHDPSGAEMTQLLDAISTNVTHFFREAEHFDFIAKVMCAWHRRGQRRFRLWSAACATGEEPYSLAMTLAQLWAHSHICTTDLDLRILATDISTQALATAMRGCYSDASVEAIPQTLRRRYLRKQHTDDGRKNAVADVLKRDILFRQINLTSWPIPLRGDLDVIFCRNVMIYFDATTRETLVGEFFRLLRPGGVLIVSHSESLVGLDVPLIAIRPSIYTKSAASTNHPRQGASPHTAAPHKRCIRLAVSEPTL